MFINTSNRNTFLSFLLALNEFSDSLTFQEQDTLKEVGKQLNTQPKAWEKYIQPLFLKTIESNPKLNKFYQIYKKKLDTVDIPVDLLPKDNEINQLIPATSNLQSRGFRSNAPATDYQQQLNNIVTVVCESDKSEDVVKKINSLDKLKQFISRK